MGTAKIFSSYILGISQATVDQKFWVKQDFFHGLNQVRELDVSESAIVLKDADRHMLECRPCPLIQIYLDFIQILSI